MMVTNEQLQLYESIGGDLYLKYEDDGALVIQELCDEVRRLTAEVEQLDAVQDYAAYYNDVCNMGDAPETFVNWYNGANQASNPYVTQPQEVTQP